MGHKTSGSFVKGHAKLLPKDKFGKEYKTSRDAEYADLCYEMVDFLTAGPEIKMTLEEATRLVEKIRQATPDSHVVRSRLKSFISQTELYLNRTPGRL